MDTIWITNGIMNTYLSLQFCVELVYHLIYLEVFDLAVYY